MFAKPTGRVRDSQYMAWIRENCPCAAVSLGAGPCIGQREVNHAGRRPVGRKSSDLETFVLCHGHHVDWTGHWGVFRYWSRDQRREWADQQIGQTRAAYDRHRGVDR